MDNVTVGTTVVYFFPGINVASGPPYSLMPNIVVELTLANTVAATSTTYTNYDETVYAEKGRHLKVFAEKHFYRLFPHEAQFFFLTMRQLK